MNNENVKTEYDFSGLTESFHELITNPKLVFQVIEFFPIPIQVFAPDGLLVYSNRALLDFNNIPDVNALVGKYNLLHDPVCDELIGHDILEKAFRGEAVPWCESPMPIQDLINRGVVKERPYESAFIETTLFPVWDNDKVAYIVNIMIIRGVYQGHHVVAKAKEYIDNHWMDEFNAGVIAKAVYINEKHLNVLFKQDTGMKLIDYYKKIKVDHIKEKLLDKSFFITEAFSLYGGDNRGAIGRAFKKQTGMTPKEYRDSFKSDLKPSK